MKQRPSQPGADSGASRLPLLSSPRDLGLAISFSEGRVPQESNMATFRPQGLLWVTSRHMPCGQLASPAPALGRCPRGPGPFLLLMDLV